MALQLNTDTPFGITATYHKATFIENDTLAKKAVITISSWLDLATRTSHPDNPFKTKIYTFRGDNHIDNEGRNLSYPFTNDQITDDPRVIYLRIKTFPEWQDSVDC